MSDRLGKAVREMFDAYNEVFGAPDDSATTDAQTNELMAVAYEQGREDERANIGQTWTYFRCRRCGKVEAPHQVEPGDVGTPTVECGCYMGADWEPVQVSRHRLASAPGSSEDDTEPCPMCGGAGYQVMTHYVTKDMASDAGEPALEGMPMEEKVPCDACASTGRTVAEPAVESSSACPVCGFNHDPLRTKCGPQPVVDATAVRDSAESLHTSEQASDRTPPSDVLEAFATPPKVVQQAFQSGYEDGYAAGLADSASPDTVEVTFRKRDDCIRLATHLLNRAAEAGLGEGWANDFGSWRESYADIINAIWSDEDERDLNRKLYR